ncbi:MAG: preprotein translocase subunit YajC [Bacteroidota bacterium]|jgi:preprotein translocase subunit YajC
MDLNLIMLMAGGGGADQKGGGYQSLIFLGLIIVVFYFFMIRPQMKKTKEAKKFREALKKGDKIVTIGGIHGRIVEDNNPATFVIETEGGGRLRIERIAVASNVNDVAIESK